MPEYPKFVKDYRPKGTVAKKQGKKYNIYKAASKRVPGKKYLVQVIEERIGAIDQRGFHPLREIKIDVDDLMFSNVALLIIC